MDMASFDRNGYAIADLVLTATACETIAAELPGMRDLLCAPSVQRLLAASELTAAIRQVVDEPLVPVTATLVDQTANGRVQWHQDRVEAPANVTEKILAMRIHLDESGPYSGPLRVIPGSHLGGKLSDDEIRQTVSTNSQLQLALPQGSVLFMRPLLVHASSPATNTAPRRVLHVELAPI